MPVDGLNRARTSISAFSTRRRLRSRSRSVRELAEAVNDTPGPVVTGFYEWGRWVNGGAWLTIGGQRVDFIYRNIEHLERVIAEAEAGRSPARQRRRASLKRYRIKR